MDADQQMVARAAGGDEAAFRAIWSRYRDEVYRFNCWMLQDGAAAEDVTQECFLALLEHPARFDPSRGPLRTFLLAIARNHCRTRRRDALPEVELVERTAEAEALSGVLAAESAAMLRAAIEELPPLQREALYLFEYEELTLVQAAATAETDIGTFKSRLHRARQALKRALAEEGM